MAQKEIATKVEEFDLASAISERPSLANAAYFANEAEEDIEPKSEFDVKIAWKKLLKIPGCVILHLPENVQKDLGILVGVNVSQEFPWKQIKFRYIADMLDDEVEGWPEFKDQMNNISIDDLILMGYAGAVIQSDDSEERYDDPFITFATAEGAKQASHIIKNIETYERWLLNKQLVKYGRPWVSQGSEKEVDVTIPRKRSKIMNVEFQSVYPIRILPRSQLLSRTTDDVRDGYVELVPSEKSKIENVYRQRVSIGIQSAPDKVTLEQQTDPTFPANSWSQYLYEITEEDVGLDESSDEEKPAKSATPTPDQKQKDPPELSQQVKSLLKMLEFNQIDMYRNDYCTLTPEKMIMKYQSTFLEENACFVDVQKSSKRFVSGVDWFPSISGLVVASYTFSTIATPIKIGDKTNRAAKTVVEHNPVLMWSFSDSLNFRLEFFAPREITCLSFCPYDGNILIGGTINGQLIIWDLQDRLTKIDEHEVLTPEKARYRELILAFLDWTKFINEEITIQPTAISVIETSQKGPITEIHWFNRKFYISKTGRIYESEHSTNRYFATTSLDGSIAFWSLDSPVHKKKRSGIYIRGMRLPSPLIQNISEFKKYDQAMKPEFLIRCSEPISACILDFGKFNYEVQIPEKIPHDLNVTMPVTVEEVPQKSMRAEMCVSSLFGNIDRFGWEGFDYETGEAVNTEKITITAKYPAVHDGFIYSIVPHPFLDDIFLTYGKHVLALWKRDFNTSPITWRKRPAEITCAKWSFDRPSVIFLTRSDGNFEVWDILAKSVGPTIIEPVGGGIITALCEHRPLIPKKLIGIGDYNSTFRMLALPPTYYRQLPDELENFKKVIDKELRKKEFISEWQKEWCERNAEIIQAKKQAEEAALFELELARQREAENVAKREQIEIEEKKKAEKEEKKKGTYDLPERLNAKFDKMLLDRYMEVLIERTKINRKKLEKDTKLEEHRLEYEKAKRDGLRNALRKIEEEIAMVRARLLPKEKKEHRRISVVKELSREVKAQGASYEAVEAECNDIISNYPEYEVVNYHDLLDRGKARRTTINEALGTNTLHRRYYKALQRMKKTYTLDFGFEDTLAKRTRDSSESSSELFGDADDEIPVKDENDDAIGVENEKLEEKKEVIEAEELA